MTTPWRTRWSNLKRILLTAAGFVVRSWRGVAAIGTILAVVAAGIQDFDKISEWYRKNTLPLGPVVGPSQGSFDVEELADRIFTGEESYLNRYVLVLGLNLDFKESAEDLKPFLNTLSGVERLFYNGKEEEFYRLFPELLGGRDIHDSKVYVAVRFESRPARGDVLLIDFGPIRQKFTLGDLAWVKQVRKSEGDEIRGLHWFSSYGLGELTLAEPTWAIIRKVRVLVAPSGKPDVLEAIIDNRSANDIAINDFHIEAAHKNEHPVVCKMPAPPRFALLSFEKISVVSGDTTAWSEIDGEKFAAKASIGGGCGMMHELDVHAPFVSWLEQSELALSS
ncbi:hypothetical protein JET68_18090 [Pseudomonas monteilii]|uniref:hypothetical protein n=1 Tax=Pseudomonas TaxID=286 RepID=UPI0018E6A330|nr:MULTISPECIES: hypothetical protein [Pseudomonas]MBI6920719.1 hypothetical protein [Pseudomonas monteilii]MCE0938547.1 hypothetical protein [Pseudomonas kurunegalensis]